MKEWLCLNCQMQRALGVSEPPGLPMIKPKPSSVQMSNQPASSPMDQKAVPIATEDRTPKHPSQKQEPVTLSTGKEKDPPPQDLSKSQISPSVPQQSKPQPPQNVTSSTKVAPPTTQNVKQESGGFFGFGGPKPEPASTKPAESVTGKMFGFGSSIFNSASTLITTPPVSPKMSATRDTKPPAVQKAEQEKKPVQPQQAKAPPSPSVQAKVDKAPSEPSKAAAPKAGQSTCPLCKVGLNMGSKDPPNYNTCTDCKNTVCNQCGFNPMPHTKEVCQSLVLRMCLYMPCNNHKITTNNKPCQYIFVCS